MRWLAMVSGRRFLPSFDRSFYGKSFCCSGKTYTVMDMGRVKTGGAYLLVFLSLNLVFLSMFDQS